MTAEDGDAGAGATGGGSDATDRGAVGANGGVPTGSTTDPTGDTSAEDLAAELDELREELSALEADVADRTVHRADLERDLRSYVRRRVGRTRARGWGPYLVLLYGTIMTVGAFHYLSAGWAVLAMIVVWLSTLGLYVFMVVVGASLHLASLPRRAIGRLRNR